MLECVPRRTICLNRSFVSPGRSNLFRMADAASEPFRHLAFATRCSPFAIPHLPLALALSTNASARPSRYSCRSPARDDARRTPVSRLAYTILLKGERQNTRKKVSQTKPINRTAAIQNADSPKNEPKAKPKRTQHPGVSKRTVWPSPHDSLLVYRRRPSGTCPTVPVHIVPPTSRNKGLHALAGVTHAIRRLSPFAIRRPPRARGAQIARMVGPTIVR